MSTAAAVDDENDHIGEQRATTDTEGVGAGLIYWQVLEHELWGFSVLTDSSYFSRTSLYNALTPASLATVSTAG